MGLNTICLNNVNACGGGNDKNLDDKTLAKEVGPVARIFGEYGIKSLLSICFDLPRKMGHKTSDPLAPEVRAFWTDRAQAAANATDGHFKGFLAKADSEGNIGPIHYNRTEAQGANCNLTQFVSSDSPCRPGCCSCVGQWRLRVSCFHLWVSQRRSSSPSLRYILPPGRSIR